MLNQLIIVGRIKSIEDKDEETKIILKVPRHFKNENEEYETDYIPFILKGSIGQNVKEYCSADDVVGIKGYVISNNNGIELIAEKVTFLSSKEKHIKDGE